MRPWLDKCRPEVREKIIRLEAELRKCDEEIAEIDNLLLLNETGGCLLSFDNDI